MVMNYVGLEYARSNAANFSLQVHQIIRSATESSVSIRICLLAYIWSDINDEIEGLAFHI